MASAKKVVVTPAVPAVEKVTLELSMLEARALLSVLGRVGGDPRTTARRHTDEVYYALYNAGVESEADDEGGQLFRGYGTVDSPSLYFIRDLTGEVR